MLKPQISGSTWLQLLSYSFASLHGSSWNEIEVDLLPVTQSIAHLGSGILNSVSPMSQVLFSAGYIVMGAVVIGLLGCGPDATRMYSSAWSWSMVHLRLRRHDPAVDSRVTSGRGSTDWRAATTPSSSVFASWRGGAGARVKRIGGSRSDGQLSRQSSIADVELAMRDASPASTMSQLDVVHSKDDVEMVQHA